MGFNFDDDTLFLGGGISIEKENAERKQREVELHKRRIANMEPLIQSEAFKNYEEATKKFCQSEEFKEYLGAKSSGYEIGLLERKRKGYPNVTSCDAASIRSRYEESKRIIEEYEEDKGEI